MLAAVGASVAPALVWADNEPTYTVELDSQPLSESLKSFADQTGLQVVFFSEATNGVQAVALNGNYTADAALDTLLDDSGLTYEYINDRAVTIKPVRSTAAEDLSSGKSRPASSPVLMAQSQASAAQSPDSRTNRATNDDYGEEERPTPLEEIIVTGTHLRGVTNPASPVITFDREDILMSGAASLPDFIQTIPQNFTGGFTDVTANVPGAAGENGNFARGTGINLRGLGSDSTLVLLNGRRLAPAGLGRFTDVSTIPASAVERIEVVLDGASAVYGSDAVGGVVNIILRDDFEGAETQLRYGTVTDGNYDSQQASQALGVHWNSGRVFANYEYSSQSPLRNTDRSYTEGSPFPYDLSNDIESHSVFIAASQEVFDESVLFATANYSTRESFGNGTLPTLQTTTDVSVDQYSGVVGLEWNLPGSWLAEISTTFSKYDTSTLRAFPTRDLSFFTPNEQEVWAWDAKADGDLFELPGGAAKLALGAGTRNESFLSPFDDTTLDRDVRYLFAESVLPIVQPGNTVPGVRSLEVSAALRYEEYDDEIGSSTDGKFGIVWSPIESLQIRATVGTSFRAPLLFEAAPAGNNTILNTTPDPQSPTGETAGLFILGQAVSRAAPELSTPLKPEEAETVTIGMDFAPASWPGFTASVSYFDVDFTDRIAAPGGGFSNVLLNPGFEAVITRNPTAEQIATAIASSAFFRNQTDIPDDELTANVTFIYDGRTANIASTKNSGIDLQLAYSRAVGQGTLGITASGTYLLELEDRLTSTSIPFDRVNTFQNPIDLRLRGGVSWSQNRLNTSLFVNYADSYWDDGQIPEALIGSFTTVDWTIGYELGGGSTPSIFDGATVFFAAVNVFDEDPPFVGNSSVLNANFDARNASPFGRIISLQLTKDWLGKSR